MITPLPSDEAERLRLEAHAADTGLWHRDPLTGRVYLSAEWKALLGYADHELAGDFNEFQGRLHPEDREGVLRTLHANLTKPDFEFEVGFRLRHRDGSYRWIPARSGPARAATEPAGPPRLTGPGPLDADLAPTKPTVADGLPPAAALLGPPPRPKNERFQRLLSVAVLLTVLVLVGGGGSAYRGFRFVSKQTAQVLRLEELRDTIVQSDEILTMSARMAAATGDPQWEARYRRFEPQLDAAIKAVQRLGPTPAMSQTVAQTDTANTNLVALENRAFALVRQGQAAAAQAELSSAEYAAQKQVYAAGMAEFDRLVREAITATIRQGHEHLLWGLVLAGAATSVLCLAWWRVWQMTRWWRTTLEHSNEQLNRQAVQLAEANQGLDEQVAQRTAELTGQIIERKHAERAVREREQQLQLFLEHSPAAIAMFDLDMRYLAASRRWLTEYRLAEQELFGRSHYEVFPDIPERWRAAHRRCLAGTAERCDADTFLRADGTTDVVRWEIQPWHKAAGEIGGLIIFSEVITERKAAAERLLASEERYRALVRSATDAIITADDTGTIVSWNPAAERMFGWAEAEAKGQPLLIIIPERFRAAHLAGLQRVQAGGALRVMDKPVELTGLRQDGQEFPIELALVRWQHGASSFFGGVIRDVSQRKLAEERLAEERELGEAILNHMPGVFYLITAGGQFLRWNQRFETATGYSAAEIARMRPADFVCDEHKERTTATFQKVFTEGAASFEADLLTKTGERVPFLFTGAQVVLDGLPCLAGSGVDITERKRTEGSLRLQSAALAAAANEVVITDRHGVIQWVNLAFTRSTGYTLEEAVGQNPRVLKSGKHDQAFYKNLWATILRGEVWHGEIVNRRKDQSLFTEQATITPVKDERGGITHFVAIKQDITEQKLLEAKFLRAQRLEGLGALAGGVAHDLNNVLAPILMCAEMLQTTAPDDNTKKLADMIQASTQRGAGMIRQILAFARGTAGDKVAMQVKHLLKDINRMMKDTFPPSIRTELHMDEKLSLVQGEPTELYQVLLNLCVNARDAMPGGGTITVTAANVRLDETYAHLSHQAPPGSYVVLTVADTGSGIPPEIRDKIFDAFFTTKAEGKGTGLGLATAKDIVTRHNGFIHLYSEVGVGTQFKIYLPAVAGEEAAGDTKVLTLPGGHGELVLVVDDEAAVREIVKATLEANGYHVVLADDGTQAVARFVEHIKDVQLLLTDIQMPHMDGMATIRALRNIQPGLRVIAASGLTAHQQALKVTGLNVQGFIAKPFTAASLLLALDAALHPR